MDGAARRIIPGSEVALNGQPWVLPPLPFADLKELLPRILEVREVSGLTVDMMDLIEDVVHRSLRRNYPEITKADVSGWLDASNALDVYAAAMEANRLRRTEPGEARGATAP